MFSKQFLAAFAVRALEHGTVVIWYQPRAGENLRSDLIALVGRFGHHVILSPTFEMVDPVAATAWSRLKTYGDADPETATFIETYRNRGPESIGCSY